MYPPYILAIIDLYTGQMQNSYTPPLANREGPRLYTPIMAKI